MEQVQALAEVQAIEADYEGVNRKKMLAYLLKKGLPIEVATRLDDLWNEVKCVAGHVIQVGKVIVCRIIEFIRSYPHTAMGVLIGAAIGSLTGAIPFLGPVLAPLATSLGAIVGGVAGAKIDVGCDGTQAVVVVARDFFKMLIDIFNALFNKNSAVE